MWGISLIAALVLAWCVPVYAEEGVNDVINKLQAKYDQTNDFSALFTQETVSRNIGASTVINGKVYIKKPGMMKWEYTDPKKQQIIGDGQTIWVYLPEEKQVKIFKAAEAFENLPFLDFLFGKGKITDDFTPSFDVLDKEQAKLYYLIVLTPKKKDTTIDRILILVSRNDYMIYQINLYNVLGSVTRIAFKDLAVNSGLKDSMFHFIVPSGVETIKIENRAPEPKSKTKVEIIENNK
jgi:outer membrane lipoprotein carrier protein